VEGAIGLGGGGGGSIRSGSTGRGGVPRARAAE